MWGQVIAAGIGAAASLFGKKDKPQTSTSTVNLEKMVEDAEAMGFNRLAALRAGLASGYVTTTTAGGPGSGSNYAAAGEAIGNFAGQLFGAFTQPRNDPIKVKSTTTGKVSNLVNSQLAGAVRRPGSVVSTARQTVLTSPVTRSAGAAAKGFIGPPMPLHLKLDKPIPLYVTAIDDNGKRHRIANPELPDFDQLFVPSPAVVMSETKAASEKASSWFGGWFSSGPRRHPRTGQPY